ncbi:PQ loop repeat protein [Tothia fuscella]|uniref:PQ loop repeat protein n=1 Tax=Tothia fuscella TaxID=1048955 RepID=A0A9P4P0S2_9PEZI|nr:PQ loop repeat protein [Tothia fuscella]
MDVPVAANVLGTLGAVCWSVQLIPQIIINYRRHNATGLQPSMMMLWAWAGVPLGVYNVVENFNVALRVQPQILTFLSLVTWIQCFYYERKWTVARALCVVIPIAALMGGIEAALIISLRIARSNRVDWPLTVMAVLSAALLAAGVLRHYWDIWIHRTVRGISFIFVAIDAAGDLFSLLSLFFQPNVDVLGLVIYGTELALWCGVFACGGYYNLRPWILEKWKAEKSIEPGIAEPNGLDIALHDLPSSTSVFRTPSNESSVIRERYNTRTGHNGDRNSIRGHSNEVP